MQTSRLLARFIGPLLVAMGIGLAFNSTLYATLALQFLQFYSLIYLSGLMALLAGLAILNTHNVWVKGWPVIITVLGWLTTIGGFARIIVPQAVQALGSKYFPPYEVLIAVGLVMLAVGVWLSYEGYLGTTSPKAARARRGGKK